MKVLFDHPNPFLLAHGGHQIQIEQTKAALEKMGMEVEFLRWWDSSQRGDVIHYFGRPTSIYVEQAHGLGMKVVVADLLGQWGSRNALRRNAQKVIMAAAEALLPGTILHRLAWHSYKSADACISLTPYEANIMRTVFAAPSERIHVVPNGVEEVFRRDESVKRGRWLVCTATIRDIKRVLEVGAAAVEAQTPIWFIGKPYEEADPYAQKFVQFARANSEFVRYEGPIMDRAALARVYQEARGFVLLSAYESLSIAALEAAACGCALLLSDLPWATSVFGNRARYCPAGATTAGTAKCLKDFYEAAPNLQATFHVKTWADVAQQLKEIYKRVLSTSR